MSKIMKVIGILGIVATTIIVIAGVLHFFYEVNELGNKFADIDPEINSRVEQVGNNTALLYITIEYPEEIANSSECSLKAKITRVKDSFARDYGTNRGVNLYLGTEKNLLFSPNETKLENCLCVPAKERLDVSLEISVLADVTTVLTKEKIIEVIT